jgi:hypothetical protein
LKHTPWVENQAAAIGVYPQRRRNNFNSKNYNGLLKTGLLQSIKASMAAALL